MNVLVALDGSKVSTSILPVAKRVLELLPDAHIDLITVLDPRKVRGRFASTVDTAPIGSSTGTYAGTPPRPTTAETHGDAMSRAETDAREHLEAIASEYFPNVDVSAHVEWSESPAEAIVGAAEKLQADFIAMSTHGRSGISHVLAGSVTEHVMRTAPRPVMVLGPKARVQE